MTPSRYRPIMRNDPVQQIAEVVAKIVVVAADQIGP